MNTVLIGALGMLALLILIGLRFHIGAAMASVGIIGIIIMRGFKGAISIAASAPFANLNSNALAVIPLFTLMGTIIAETSIGKKLYQAANSLLGRQPGGLASATVVAGGLLGAITGGHYVACNVLAKVSLPEMRRYGYGDQLAAAAIACSAPLAIIIPPSLPFIMYGIMTELSIGKLFMCGVGPGILTILLFIGYITIYCMKRPDMGPKGAKIELKQKLKDLRGIIPVLVLFLLVLGSIYTGLCSTVEAGALGSAGALVIALVMKDLTLKKLWICFKETLITVGMVLFLLCGTYIFISFISMSGLPTAFSQFVMSLDVPVAVILLGLAIMYFILGMFMPDIPMLLLTVPVVFPAMSALGVEGYWLGFFIVMLMAIGSVTPPIGIVVFILGGVSKIDVGKIFKGVIPFVLIELVVLLICSFIPQIVTFIPNSMG